MLRSLVGFVGRDRHVDPLDGFGPRPRIREGTVDGHDPYVVGPFEPRRDGLTLAEARCRPTPDRCRSPPARRGPPRWSRPGSRRAAPRARRASRAEPTRLASARRRRARSTTRTTSVNASRWAAASSKRERVAREPSLAARRARARCEALRAEVGAQGRRLLGRGPRRRCHGPCTGRDTTRARRARTARRGRRELEGARPEAEQARQRRRHGSRPRRRRERPDDVEPSSRSWRATAKRG